MPPGWSAWHTVLNADTNHYFYGYTINNNGTIDGPFGDSGSWDTREYGVRDDIGCPFAPTNGLPCYYETDILDRTSRRGEMLDTPAEQPFYLQLDYTAPHGDFRRPAGPEPAPRHYDWFKGAPLPHDRRKGFDEGNVTDKPRFIREAAHLTLNDMHTYRVYWQKQLESLRSIDDGVKLIIDTLGAAAPPAQHLRHLHLRQRLLLRRAPADRRQVPRLRAGHPPALPDPRAGDQARHLEPASSPRNIDIAPTVLELAGVEATRASTAARWSPSCTTPSCAPAGRSSSSPSSKPATSKRRAAIAEPGDQSRPPAARAGATPAARPGDGATASLLAPPKDYEGIRLGPYKYIAWPDGEKELYDIEQGPLRAQQHRQASPTTSRSATSSTANCSTARGLRRAHCREAAPKFPLTRIELRRRQAARREKQERREKRERGTGTQEEEQKQQQPADD